MLAFPGMLIPAAERAKMKCPKDADKFDRNEFPHFYVFCMMQLGRSLVNSSSHWSNAEIIAKIPDDSIKTVTPAELCEMGFV